MTSGIGAHFTKQTTVFSLAFMIASSAINTRVLTGSTCDNSHVHGARSIIAQWLCMTIHVLQCIFVSYSQHWHMVQTVCTLVLLLVHVGESACYSCISQFMCTHVQLHVYMGVPRTYVCRQRYLSYHTLCTAFHTES